MVETIAPLVPPDVDLRRRADMPLDVETLLDSDMFALASGEAFRAAVALWCRSWHQVPAASLPDNDKVLAMLSMAGSRWRQVRTMALRGWVKASDGRLYHPVVARKAVEAWHEIQAAHGAADHPQTAAAAPQIDPLQSARAKKGWQKRKAKEHAGHMPDDAAACAGHMPNSLIGDSRGHAAALDNNQESAAANGTDGAMADAGSMPRHMPDDAAACAGHGAGAMPRHVPDDAAACAGHMPNSLIGDSRGHAAALDNNQESAAANGTDGAMADAGSMPRHMPDDAAAHAGHDAGHDAGSVPRHMPDDAGHAAAYAGNGAKPGVGADVVALIGQVDDAMAAVFGEDRRRPWARPADTTVARRWIETGIGVDVIVAVVTTICERRKAQSKPPPKTLQYFDDAVRHARSEADTAEKAAADRQDDPRWSEHVGPACRALHKAGRATDAAALVALWRDDKGAAADQAKRVLAEADGGAAS